MHARLFLALWPDAAVRAQLAQWRDGWSWPRSATPVRSERLHMTLHFIGDVPEVDIDAVAAQLAAPFDPFALDCGAAVLWPHGIAVLEPLSTPDALVALHAALRERLTALGLPVDARSFKPHVMMARRACGATLRAAGPAFTWPVDHYCLMRSRLGAGGGYDLVRQYSCAKFA